MSARLVTAAALAALLACEPASQGDRAERPARAEADGAPARPAPPAAERPSEGRTSVRRGDRHARAAARQSPKVKRVEGTLARSGPRQVVIRPAGRPELTLRVAPTTTVTLDGRPARADALREGVEVRASYETGSGGRPTAIRIEANAPKPPAERRPAWTPPEPPQDNGG